MRSFAWALFSVFLSPALWLGTGSAAQWPLAPQGAEHEIVRDYGQHYVPPSGVGHSIHKALDFDVPTGTDVFSAAAGVLVFIPTEADASAPYFQRRVFSTDGDHAWEYWHIAYEAMNPNPPEGGQPRAWMLQDPVAPAVTLGHVVTTGTIPPHLHFAYAMRDLGNPDPYATWRDSKEVENPLKMLTPNADGTAPVIRSVAFGKIDVFSGQSVGTYAETDGSTSVIHGPVDIIVDAYDLFGGFSPKIGVYSLGFEVTGPASFINEQSIRFSGDALAPTLSPDIVYSNASTADTFEYVVTNNNGDGILNNTPANAAAEYDRSTYWNVSNQKPTGGQTTAIDASSLWNIPYRNSRTGELKTNATGNGDALFPDGLYALKITAKDYAGNTATKQMQIKIDCFTPPASPTNLVGADGDGLVHLSWDPPQTSQDGSTLTDLAEYRVYYGIGGPEGPYQGIEATEGLSPVAFPAPPPSAGAVAFTLNGLVSDGGTVYFIRVAAVDSNGNESTLSNVVSSRPQEGLWTPEPYGTIQEALNAAAEGDTVIVRSQADPYLLGTALNFPRPNVTLRSERGPAETKLDVATTGVTINAARGARIIGFTFQSQGRKNAAVTCYFDFDVLVANNIFIGTSTGVYSGGNFVPPRIFNNTFVDNDMGERSAYFGLADLRNNIFVHNRVGAGPDFRTLWYGGKQYTTVVSHNGFFDNQIKVQNAAGQEIFALLAGMNPRNAGNQELVPDAGFVADGSDYRLRPGSPALHQGDEAAEMTSVHGMDWTKNPDGSRTDLGAYGGPLPRTWRVWDNDLDGTLNAIDPDDDNDCLTDVLEDKNGNGSVDPGETDPFDADTDDDGRTDGNCGSEDLNANGIYEPQLGETDPRNADSDGDGIQDGTENGLPAPESPDTDLTVFVADADPATTTEPLVPDTDGDGLLDGAEDADRNGAVGAGETDPRRADCDGDGFSDGQEISGGSDPLDPASVPNHPPALTGLVVALRADGSGLVEASFTGSDAEGDSCVLTLKEVSRDGLSWVPLPISGADPRHTAREPLTFTPGGSSYTIVGDAGAAFGAVEDGEVYVRLEPGDGRASGAVVVSAAFALDTIPPRIAVAVPALSNAPVTPVITVSDGLDPAPAVALTLDGAPWAGGSVGEGEHTLSVAARDAAGNASSWQASFVVDLSPPAISFDGAVSGGVYASDVQVSWRATDALDPAPAASGNYPSPHLFDLSGRYTLNVTATDAAGNLAARSLSFAIYELADLPLLIDAMGIDAGVKNSLLSKVQNAQAAREEGRVNAAVNLLEAFGHAVEAQRGKKILVADADLLLDFARQIISLLQNSWNVLSLGEVFLPGDDAALAAGDTLLAELEANAVSRVVLELYQAKGTGSGRLLLAESSPWSGRGALAFLPADTFDLPAFLAEAERRGIDVLAGLGALASGAAPGEPSHVAHLSDVASYLLATYPRLKGICLTELEAPHQAAATSALVASVKGAVAAQPGRLLGLLVGSPASDADLASLADAKGQDLATLGAAADLLYLGTFAHVDANQDGVADHDPSWPGEVVRYVGALGLPAGLVPLVATGDVLEPFSDGNENGIRDDGESFADLNGDGLWGIDVSMTAEKITAIISGLPGDLLQGIAIYRHPDTSTSEWEALLNSHPQ